MESRINNLQDLFLEQSKELYDVSEQEQRELPLIQQKVTNPLLRKIITRQINVAKNQGIRLKSTLKTFNTDVSGERSECCRAVFKQAKGLIDRTQDERVRDAAIISSVQRLNHNNITSLGSLASFAKEIGHFEIANTLHETINEEKAIDLELSNLAKSGVNKKAVSSLIS